jgi:hypothetical protein
MASDSTGDNIFRPKFLYKNKIRPTEIYTSSATDTGDPAGVNIQMNQFQANKLTDRNVDSLAQFAQKDGFELTWIPDTPQKISRIILQNSSSKPFDNDKYDYYIKYRDTFGVEQELYPSVQVDITKLTDYNGIRNYYFEFDQVEITELRLARSLGPNNPIGTPYTLGQWVATNEISEFSNNMGHSIKDNPKLIQRLLRLSDGSTSKTFIRRIFNYQIKVSMVRGSDLDNLNTLERINRTDSFIFIPNPIEFQRDPATGLNKTYILDSNEWWDGRANHYNFKRFELEAFTADYRINGKSGRLDIEQAGGVR